MRRFVALAVFVVLLLPGLLAALPSCEPEDGGCAMPMAGAHDCCPPPAASLVADCCVTSSPAVPRPAPTTPERAAPATTPLLAQAIAPPPLVALAPPSAAPPLLPERGERHVVLRR